MAEWGDAGTDFVTRVQHLSGTPGGANGSVLPHRRDGPNDTSVDQLFGDADRDWFLFTASGRMRTRSWTLEDGEVLTGL